MEVRHSPDDGMFFIAFPDGVAFLKYLKKDDALNAITIFVPESHRGEGIAEQLSKEFFGHCKKNYLKVIPTCSYLKNKFLQHHKEYQVMVKD